MLRCIRVAHPHSIKLFPYLCLLSVLFFLSFDNVSSQSDLLTNPSFESGTFSGWTSTLSYSGINCNNVSTSLFYSADYPAADGECYAYGGPGSLSQAVNVVDNALYYVSLYVCFWEDEVFVTTGYTITAIFSGGGTATTLTETGRSLNYYKQFAAYVTAPSTGTHTLTLTFTDTQNVDYVFVDDADINLVPPSSSSSTASSLDPPPVDPSVDPPSALGDPAFTGFLGQKYQIHGVADNIYSLISDASCQLNALFVFLNAGMCPSVLSNHTPLIQCWSHPGSYFGTLTFQTRCGDRILLDSGTAHEGFSLVQINGALIDIGSTIMLRNDDNCTLADITSEAVRPHVYYADSHAVIIATDVYELTLHNSDMFINIHSVVVKDWNMIECTLQPHGLLGQTWRRVKAGTDMEVKGIQGYVDNYAEENDSIWGTNTVYNQFIPYRGKAEQRNRHSIL